MNHYFVDAGPGGIERVQHVQMRATRKVFGIEKAAHVSAEITAAASDKNFHSLRYSVPRAN